MATRRQFDVPLYHFDDIVIECENFRVQKGDETRTLAPRAFDLLVYLIEHRNRVIEKPELFEQIWKDVHVTDNALTRAIKDIRRAIGDDAVAPHYIETVPKRGYRFIAEVKTPDEAKPEPQQPMANVSQETPAPPSESVSILAQELVRPEMSREARASFRLGGPKLIASAIICGVVVVAALVNWKDQTKPDRAEAINVLRTMQTTPLTSYVGLEMVPVFSPDGKQLAFAWDGEKGDNFDIYVKQVDTGTPHRLTTHPADDSFPAWSPDGSHIAFTRHTEESYAIYLVPSLSGPERKLADIFPRLMGHSVGGDGLTFSSDGKFLAVPDKSASGEPFSIVLISIETGEKHKLTSPSAGSLGDNTPAFSPDGSQFAFSRMSGQGAEDIYLMPAVGGESRRLTFDNRFIRDLDWTADGREIVFISHREGDTGLWRVSASGGTPERLVTAVGYEITRSRISRQGNRLVYTQYFVDANIWRGELAGTQQKVIASTQLISSSKSDSGPQYAPEGNRITFRSDRSGSFEIWTCEAGGSNPVQLTNFNGPQTGSPSWSPDGRQIAFDARPEGNPDIFVISAEGGRPRRLTEDPAEEILPNWSRDGRWIYFQSNRSGSVQIWKIPADGGEARQVTKGGGSLAYESVDGKFLYHTKGRNVAGIWRVSVEGGEETLVLNTHQAGHWSAWTVVEQGIYFLTAEKRARPAIEFFSFMTGRVTEVAQLAKPFRPWTNPEGLSVSPDGRWILYTQEDRADMDIMLVENFR